MTVRGVLRALLPSLLTAALAPAALAAPAVPGWDDARYLNADALKPGMRGYGRSVFRGSEADTFSVEILGVMPTSTPHQRMILARLSGQGLEKSGVVAGMSGSPIYVDGKLIGALAFGWSFASEPITGITPIADMLALAGRDAAPVGGEGEAAVPSGPGMDPGTWRSLLQARGREALDVLLRDPPEPRADTWAPLRIPVAVGGFTPGLSPLVDRFLAGLGFLPVQAGAVGAEDAGSGTLKAGDALGLELARGDAQLAAIGTVTWTDGDRVLAFGHPMMERGAAAYPMTSARIITVMPRLSSSFKMGVVGRPLGAITRDYGPGVMGSLGPSPRMIPLDVDLDLDGRPRSLHFELLDAQELTPALAGFVTANGMQRLNRASGPITIRTAVTVNLADGRSVTTHSTGAGFSPPGALAGDVARLVGLLAGNPFQPVDLASITVKAEAADSIEAAFLEEAWLDPGPYRPGDRVGVTVRFRDYRGSTWSRRTGIRIPADAGPGTYRLSICDGQRDGAMEASRAPERYDPKNLDRLLVLLGEELPQDTLVLRLLDGASNPVVGGRELPRLPASMKSAVTSPLSSGRVSSTGATVIATHVETLDKLLIGCLGLSLTVEPAR